MSPDFLAKMSHHPPAPVSYNTPAAPSETVEDMMRQQLQLSRAIYADTQRVRRYMFWRLVFNIIWILIVLAPVLFALWFLPPMWQQFSQIYLQDNNTIDLIKQLNAIK